MNNLKDGGEEVVLLLCLLALITGSLLLRDWWRDNRAAGR